MAGSVNKVILVGNLGRDPEIRSTQDGMRVANLSLATSEQWRDRASGERKERTEWHRVVIFNERLVELAQKYLRKGSKIYVEGALQTRKWTDQQGQDRYSTEVVLQRFRGELTMLDGARGGEPDSAGEFEEGYAGGYGEAPGRAMGGGAGRRATTSTTRSRSDGRPAVPRRSCRQPAAPAGAAEGAAGASGGAARRGGTARHRGPGDRRGGAAPGGARAARGHRRRDAPRLVAHGFPLSDRRRGPQRPAAAYRVQERGRDGGVQPDGAPGRRPAHPDEDDLRRRFCLSQIGCAAGNDGQADDPVAVDAALPRRSRRD